MKHGGKTFRQRPSSTHKGLKTGACMAYQRNCKERSEGKVLEMTSEKKEGSILETQQLKS